MKTQAFHSHVRLRKGMSHLSGERYTKFSDILSSKMDCFKRNRNRETGFFVLCIIGLAVNGSNGDPDFTYSAADLYRLTQTEQRFSKVIKEISTAVDDFKEDVASVL